MSYSGAIKWPTDQYDQRLFDSGVEAFFEGSGVPFPGADTWPDMMTNQGWVAAQRGLVNLKEKE